MNRIFIELYLGEDVDVHVAHLIRARGFKATTTREAGRKGENDDEQLAYAVTHKGTLVTHNREHFEALAEEYLMNASTGFEELVTKAGLDFRSN